LRREAVRRRGANLLISLTDDALEGRAGRPAPVGDHGERFRRVVAGASLVRRPSAFDLAQGRHENDRGLRIGAMKIAELSEIVHSLPAHISQRDVVRPDRKPFRRIIGSDRSDPTAATQRAPPWAAATLVSSNSSGNRLMDFWTAATTRAPNLS
jgi:hypothetical protein